MAVSDQAAVPIHDAPATAAGPVPDYWIAPQAHPEVRGRAETVFEVLSHLPLRQPVAVVSDAGQTIAVNGPLLALAGGGPEEHVGGRWSRAMPKWPERARGLLCEGEQVFTEHLVGVAGESTWVRVSVSPVCRLGTARALAYVLYISRSGVEVVDHDEVRRLRKSRELLAEVQTDYVVEVDQGGTMTFVSPSFCRAVGACESELIGRAFVSRVCVEDRAAAGAALEEAGRPPFCGEMLARLAAESGTPVDWQIEGIIGDGVAGLELLGRPRRT